MRTNTLCTRRRVLQLTGGAAVAGLAGCVGSASDDSTAGSDGADGADGDDHDDGQDAGHHDGTTEGHDEEGGHDDGHGHEEGVGEPTDTAEVTMLTGDGGYHFEAHVVRVTVGGTVTFVNESGQHSTAAYHPDNDQPRLVPEGAESWDSELLTEAGATFEHTFETEGVYHYYCAPHETTGMIGSVIVGEPDAHGQPALEDPPEDKPERVREKLASLTETCNEALGHTH